MAKLNEKQQRFAEEYLVDLNATQAAIRAGYSQKTAGAKGHELLKIVGIQKAIAEGRASLSESVEKKAVQVFREIEEVTQRAKDQGDLKAALRGLELQGNHLGMFTKKVEHSGEIKTTPELTVVVQQSGTGTSRASK